MMMEGCYKKFRIDLVFDNDLITWSHDSTRVEKGTYLGGFTEGDSSAKITPMKLFTMKMSVTEIR